MVSVPVTQRMAPESISQAVVPPSVKKLKALGRDGWDASRKVKQVGTGWRNHVSRTNWMQTGS